MENQGQTFAQLYHQALVNPKEVSQEDFDLLLSRYPYSQPLHFALERRKFLCGELTKLGSRAILLASSPNWLHDYIQLPVQDIPFIAADDEDALVADLTSPAVSAISVLPEQDIPVSEHAETQENQVKGAVETSNDTTEAPALSDIDQEDEGVADRRNVEPLIAAANESDHVTDKQISIDHSHDETPVEEAAISNSVTDDEVHVDHSHDAEPVEEAAISNSVTDDEVNVDHSHDEAPVEEAAISHRVGADGTAAADKPKPEEIAADIPDEGNATEVNVADTIKEDGSFADATSAEQAENDERIDADRENSRNIDLHSDSLSHLTTEEENAALENLVHEGIGGGDYFALHNKEIRWETNVGLSGNKETGKNSGVISQPADPQKEEDVSVYNDELMPYSFRWWLHKTRLEYADTYQPFASPYLPTNKKSSFDPEAFDKVVLDQQIRENIIHLQSPEDKLSDEVKKRAVTFSRVDKTTEVIERFIREEPQIQPPPADQLNMENKARKSSEEQFTLVTETLANIYASQGMYVKAIEVYKKLILKFPEKKSYFATQIKGLEEKLY
ncbi:hypothetical protein [Sphingobacterium paludis]|uniref:Tetratricopeptide repeat protein n=1 Tax=Sphingobacterium paludis TaxID=1476465 RepID=A0A4R7CZN5_9SPHI|nr:hypothetical protein [Sphingobacterium paludis]TDS13860.1 hypothetical protein B0I21_104186 [Sphingobacterium paludis]